MVANSKESVFPASQMYVLVTSNTGSLPLMLPRLNLIFLVTEHDLDPPFVDLTRLMTMIAVVLVVIAPAVTGTVTEAPLDVVITTMIVVAMAVLPCELVVRLMTIHLHDVVASMTLIVVTIRLLIHTSMAMVDRRMIDRHPGTIPQEMLAMLMTIAVAVTSNYSRDLASNGMLLICYRLVFKNGQDTFSVMILRWISSLDVLR
jgi:hypothetical protein